MGDLPTALHHYRDLVVATDGKPRFARKNLAGLYYVATVLFKQRELSEAVLFARRVILSLCQSSSSDDGEKSLDQEYRLGAAYV